MFGIHFTEGVIAGFGIEGFDERRGSLIMKGSLWVFESNDLVKVGDP